MQEVSTENELLSAISALVSSNRPGTIVIVAPFSVSAPIVIPGFTVTGGSRARGGCDGITIKTSGRHALTPIGILDCLFDVRARDVTIEGIFVEVPLTYSTGTTTANEFTDFIVVRAVNTVGGPLVVRNCDVAVQRALFRDEGTGGTGFDVVDFEQCRIFQMRTPTTTPMIGISTSHYAVRRVVFCPFDSGGPFTAIKVTNSATGGVIIGNDFDGETNEVGCSIDTSAGGGGCYLACNTGLFTGTKTLHADDLDLDDAGGGWTTVAKTATETRTSTAVLADDATLKFTMAASTTYRFRATIFYNTSLNGDFRYQVNGPAATKVSVLCTHAPVGTAPANQVVDTSYANTASGALDGSGGDGCVKIEGIIQNNTAGTLAFQWAQGTSDASNTSVLKGSYIEYAVVA